MSNDTSGSSAMEDTEIEVKLAIRSEDPVGVMEAVAGLETVDGFRLLPLPAFRIRDTYLGLPRDGRAADGGRLALRRREVDGRALLTLKGESGAAEEGVTRRLEIEVPESEAGWRRIRAALGEAGVQEGEALEYLDALRPFQIRETLRLRRAVVPLRDPPGAGGATGTAADGDPVAELTMDTVTLEVVGRRVRFREVEVEAGPGADEPARLVAEVGTALRNAVGRERLRPWSLSKLATGVALESLAEAGELDGLVGVNGDLLPAGLDRLGGSGG
ncbi:hypothetical protein BH23GEM11_BH23GEM11_07440 [soil metagenome]